ncbi:hypothetical protein E2562_032024 [Oryza meyeriana var. granulata]|uniref:Uncharacterized protein n=1 Tax=Oryza meyeriana var. granulata TaxID=110450 RepID=A0A6G1FEL5_9ORYZ|nr:hypothetical protein E2562_032024 [Oryza meyeriana var. granulata]
MVPNIVISVEAEAAGNFLFTDELLILDIHSLTPPWSDASCISYLVRDAIQATSSQSFSNGRPSGSGGTHTWRRWGQRRMLGDEPMNSGGMVAPSGTTSIETPGLSLLIYVTAAVAATPPPPATTPFRCSFFSALFYLEAAVD